ncbi:hypothetical protein KC573_04270, partial [candidate division WWE3 bacterium]|nr:hypothetical protein [candidate division WWE3 bacterium]
NYMNNIELEFRAEFSIQKYDSQVELFTSIASLHSHTQRITIMGILEQGDTPINVRVRVTKDGMSGTVASEFVIKKGAGYAHNRIEIAQPIAFDEVTGFAKIISEIVTGEKTFFIRETYNFRTDSGIDIALVRAQKHAYVEFEKLCSKEDESIIKEEVLSFMRRHSFQELHESASQDLFRRLDEHDDVVFTDYSEISEMYEGLLYQLTDSLDS